MNNLGTELLTNEAPASAPIAEGQAPASTNAEVAPSQGKWWETVQDAELKSYIEKKQWQSPEAAINSYRSLEKVMSGEKIPVPKGKEDTESWNRIYGLLGKPEDKNGYELAVPEGVDGKFVDEVKDWFHQANIGKEQAEFITKQWVERQQAEEQAFMQQMEAESKRQIESLKSEWGQDFDKNVANARVAARQFGIENDQIAAIESALGSKGMLSLFAKIGSALGEDQALGIGNDANIGSESLESISAKRMEIMQNPAYFAGDKALNAQMMTLLEKEARLKNR